jgi:hypothetical protein
MRKEHKKLETPSKLNPIGLSIVPENGLRADRRGLSPKVVRCPACAQQTDNTDGQWRCETCGAGQGLELVSAESHYSGYEPNLVPNGHEIYHLPRTVRAANERRHPRIPCRDVRACIKTEQGSSVIVNVVNISRGGLCFTGGTEFYPGAPVAIATHYIEGGHNIFQSGRIVRVHFEGSATLPGVYAVEFSDKQPLSIDAAVSGTQL